MMKFICISLVCLVGLFAGCSKETPQNFICTSTAFTGTLGLVGKTSSLSITRGGLLSSGSASLDSLTFAEHCYKIGNKDVYGFSKEDCKNINTSASTLPFRSLMFDEISGDMNTEVSGTANHTMSMYSCAKVKS